MTSGLDSDLQRPCLCECISRLSLKRVCILMADYLSVLRLHAAMDRFMKELMKVCDVSVWINHIW
jgi:hypothetical protein